MQEKYNILIVDDHPMIVESYLQGINLLNEESKEYQVVPYTAYNCETAINRIEELNKQHQYLDVVILDINLPADKNSILNSGEDLGVLLRKKYPDVKIIIISSINNNSRINSIIDNVNPRGFLLKTEATPYDLINSIKQVLLDRVYFGKTASEILINKRSSTYKLDSIDINILREIANGTKSIDLPKYISMSKSGIEKRKRNLKILFKIQSESDRELIMAAREKGYV